MTTPRKKLLLIEDEPDIVRGLGDALGFEGFEVRSAPTGAEGVALARSEAPDCILLDLMLPDMNGYQVCELVRRDNALVPIVMLTARGQESDKVRGFEVGADDYVTKPFSVAELLARIGAIFRRLDRTSGFVERLRIGDATVDLRKQTVSRARRTEALSFYENELIKLLAERQGEPVSREEILEKIWGLQRPAPNNRTVDNFIVKLRRKLEKDHKSPAHILTVYGQGYRLVP